MTREQLDEIEKRWDGYLEKDEVERRFLFEQWWDKRDFWDMTKALREALARCATLRGLADEKAHEAGLYARRMEQAQQARRTEQAKALREAWEERDEAIEARAQAGYSAAQFMRKFNEAEKERDEARAEVERLRSAISRFVSQYPWQDGPEIQELKALKEGES